MPKLINRKNCCVPNIYINTEPLSYTGSDISIVIRDAQMNPIRLIQVATYFKRVSVPREINGQIQIVNDFMTPCSPNDMGAIQMTWNEVNVEKLQPTLVKKV